MKTKFKKTTLKQQLKSLTPSHMQVWSAITLYAEILYGVSGITEGVDARWGMTLLGFLSSYIGLRYGKEALARNPRLRSKIARKLENLDPRKNPGEAIFGLNFVMTGMLALAGIQSGQSFEALSSLPLMAGFLIASIDDRKAELEKTALKTGKITPELQEIRDIKKRKTFLRIFKKQPAKAIKRLIQNIGPMKLASSLFITTSIAQLCVGATTKDYLMMSSAMIFCVANSVLFFGQKPKARQKQAVTAKKKSNTSHYLDMRII